MISSHPFYLLENDMSENHEASVGVGYGSGQLFVHGSYEAVKRVQAIILENERVKPYLHHQPTN